LALFGREVGIAFQIIDDVRDIRDDGVAPGSDLVEGVYTLPVIRARARSPELVGLLRDPPDTAALHQARQLILDSGAMATSVDRAGEHLQRARAAMLEAPGFDDAVRSQLLDLAEQVVSLGGAAGTDDRSMLTPSTTST
jgi:heptaprenyl diphosphate synthase